jgi:hypothetical protein
MYAALDKVGMWQADQEVVDICCGKSQIVAITRWMFGGSD